MLGHRRTAGASRPRATCEVNWTPAAAPNLGLTVPRRKTRCQRWLGPIGIVGFLLAILVASAPPATRVGVVSGPVWISDTEIAALPTSGAAWNSIVGAASGATAAGADVGNQDSTHDVATLAAALYTARTGLQRDRAVAALTGAIGTEEGARWLAIGRNLGAYVIAADLLDIRSGPIYDWLANFLNRTLRQNNSDTQGTLREAVWNSGSNASAQQGFAHVALAVYADSASELAWGWNGYRRYAGDRSSPRTLTSNDDSWQFVAGDPVGIQDPGATRNGIRLDGAIGNDMSRGGSFRWPPGYTQYPWVGLAGAVPAMVVFENAGHPACSIVQSAIKRAADYLYFLRTETGKVDWYDTSRWAYIKHLINTAYGVNHPVGYPTGSGQTAGFTDWTHPTQASVCGAG